MENIKPKLFFVLLLLGLIFTSMVTASPHGMLPVYAVDAVLAVSVIITGGRILKVISSLLLMFIIVLIFSDLKPGPEQNYRQDALLQATNHAANQATKLR